MNAPFKHTLLAALLAAMGPIYAQHDQNIANSDGATVRSDINNALAALFSNSSGSSAPSTTVAYQWWADTTNALLKQRNAANTAWLVRGTLTESFVIARSSNTILGVADWGKIFNATSTFTQTLTAAATLGDGWYCYYRNNGTGDITLDPNSSETIDGYTTFKLAPGDSCILYCNGSAFITIGFNGGYRSVQIFTASGTWTKPVGLKRARVTVIAGGGAGGGSQATDGAKFGGGAGGAAGGASIKTIAAATLGATETVTVGAGGTGVSGATGNGGDTSSFGAHASATGGAGGATATSAGAGGTSGSTGGIGSSGDENIRGGSGGWVSFSTTASLILGGWGGDSILGGGGPGVAAGSGNGAAGGAYGAGGAGSVNNINDVARTGGAGAAGIVIVEEFF